MRKETIEINEYSECRENECRPFSNGSEFSDFVWKNCDHCKKFNDNIDKTCAFEFSIGYACLGYGKVLKKHRDKYILNGECKQIKRRKKCIL